MTRTFALVATIGLLASQAAHADKWGCDSIAGVEDGTAGGHCCDFHDMCYAQNGCSLRPDRMAAAGACTDCDMRGDPALCDACYVAAYAYFGDGCFQCDHAVQLCIVNQGYCPAGPNECLGGQLGSYYPPVNVCGVDRNIPWVDAGRACAGDQFCWGGTCDLGTGNCVINGSEVAPPPTYPRVSPQCYPDSTTHPIPGFEYAQCGFIPTFDTSAGLGAEYLWCGPNQTCVNNYCCTQQCASQCGQADGCGGTCSTSDDTCNGQSEYVNACGRQCYCDHYDCNGTCNGSANDAGCGCGAPPPNECGCSGQTNQGCGCGAPPPNECGCSGTDQGCGCGAPPPNECGCSGQTDQGCGCGGPAPNECGCSGQSDQGCGCGAPPPNECGCSGLTMDACGYCGGDGSECLPDPCSYPGSCCDMSACWWDWDNCWWMCGG